MVVRRRKIKKSSGSMFDIPTSVPSAELNKYIVWIYGEPGIGKTSLASKFGRTFHFMFGDRDSSLRIKKAQITDWRDFEVACDEWSVRDDFDTAVIDVVDEAYELCFDFMGQEGRLKDPWGNPVEHPTDANDMGKSWKKVKRRFVKPFQTLAASDKGLVLISHGKMSKRKTAEGDEVEDVHPAISGQGFSFLLGLADILGYYHTRGTQRVLQIQPTSGVIAKCRPTENFRYSNGEEVVRIPMGENASDAFSNFTIAFENGLEPPQSKAKPVRRRTRKTK